MSDLDPFQAKIVAEIDERLETILDDAILHHHDPQSEETFEECRVCGGFDEHVNFCPIPAIDKYINSNVTEVK